MVASVHRMATRCQHINAAVAKTAADANVVPDHKRHVCA